jgi:hypothetical protein
VNPGFFRRGAIAAVIVATVASCSGPDPEPEVVPEPSLGAIPTVTSVDNVTLPMDAFTQTPQQRTLDYQATDFLVGQCMARSGASYQGDAQTRAAQLSNLTKQQNANRFGLVSEKVAAQYGYHNPPDPLAGSTKSGNGGASKECVKEAKTTLGTDAPPAEDFQLSFNVEADARARMQNDSRYKTMIGQWSACMKRAGYTYPTPQTAAEDAAWQGATVASAAELRAAGTDIRCKREVNYLGWLVTLMTAYEQQLMDKNSAVLQRLRTYYDERSRRVLALLKANGR